MHALINTLRKELLRRWRSPVATLALLAFPFLMALMIGTVSSGGGGSSFPAVKVFVLDRDENIISGLVTGLLGSGPGAEYIQLEEVGEEGFERMNQGEASAMVVFPEGFTDDVLSSRVATIQVVRNPAEGIKPEIVLQGSEVLATYLDQGSKVLGDDLDALLKTIGAEEFPGTELLLATSTTLINRLGQFEPFLFPPIVSIGAAQAEGEEDAGPSFNVFGYVLVMVSVMSVLFVTSRSILDLYDEEKTGMLRRQLASPITVAQFVNGKIVFAVVFGVLIMFVLLAAAFALGWISGAVDFLAVVLITVSFAAAACGVLSIVYALCRTDKQAAGLNWIVIMGMSALGGSMSPISSFPESVQRVSRFTLNYWAVDGLTEVLVMKETLGKVLPHVGILLAVGVLTIAIGQWMIVRKFQRALP